MPAAKAHPVSRVNFFFKNRLVPSLLWLVIGVSLTSNTLSKDTMEHKPPAIFPISLKNEGNIASVNIKISDHNVYYFGLRFSYREHDQVDRARVKKLMGSNDLDRNGSPIDSGVPTPVKLSVFKVENDKKIEILNKEFKPILTSWGSDHFKRQIVFSELAPGSYVVHLDLLRSAPEFDGTPASFSIGYDKFKTTFAPKKH
jgi:hypothetical protein